MGKEISKKGQVAIWFIVAIIIVVSIVAVFYIRSNVVELRGDSSSFPIDLRACVREVAEEAIEKIMKSGGVMEPTNYANYSGNAIEYTCQNRNSHLPCIMQHPTLITEIEKEIKDYIAPSVEECFNTLKNNFESEQNEVSYGLTNIEVALSTGRVAVNIEKDVKIGTSDRQSSYNNFDFNLRSELYDLGLLALEISNQESKYCSFENVGYEILHPDYRITKQELTDGTKIYFVENKKTNEVFIFAVRSCAIRNS